LLREGLDRLLSENGLEVFETCQTADDLFLKVRSYSPDVAIVDIRLPPTHSDEGLKAALEIRAKHPDVGVLVLSQYVEVGLALKLLADSAERTGYLLKDRVSNVEDFVDAVRRFGAGGSAVDPIIVSTLLSKRRGDDPLTDLTPREREVLEFDGRRPLQRGDRRTPRYAAACWAVHSRAVGRARVALTDLRVPGV
jgi:DNA-binding NarL/FixJ family response regulator